MTRTGGQRRDRRRRAVLALALAAAAGGLMVPLETLGPAAANAAGATYAAGSSTPTGQSTTGASCPTSTPPNELQLAAGSPQTAQLNTQFAGALQVTLANSNGCPVSGVAGTPITFSAPASGASGRFATSGTSTLTVGADSSGNAAAAGFTANSTAGSYAITASSAYGSLSFSLTNTAAGIPATITAISPERQRATVGSAYPEPLSVLVLDANHQPVPDVTITFTLGTGSGGSGGGSSAGGGGGSSGAGSGATFVGGGNSVTAQTTSAGIATSPSFAANQAPGSFEAFASSAQLQPPASFELLNLPARQERLTIVGSRRRSVRVGRRYGARLRVRLRAANGAPVLGASITFTLGTSGGAGNPGAGGTGGSSSGSSAGASFTNGSDTATVTTGRGGIAVSPAFSANTAAGSFAAVVTSPTTASVARFTLVNQPGADARLNVIGSARGSATAGQRFGARLRVRLRAANGAPVLGASITFTLGTSGGAGNPGAGGTGGSSSGSSAGASFTNGSDTATVTTGRGGIAVSPAFSANTAAGSFTATATSATTAGLARFTLTNRAGRPTIITAGAGASESTTAGTRFPIPLAVSVKDAYGNAVAGVLVRYSAPAAGPSGTFATRGSPRTVIVRTDAEGVAVARRFIANGRVGGFIVTATLPGGARTAFALVNQAR